MPDNHPRLMFAAPASGSGKTTFTVGLLQSLVNRGLKPAAFKCGPDYIDPMFHREVLGMPGHNLDLYFTPPDTARGLLCRTAAKADVSVLEGVMGFYDGVAATTRASSWNLAAETGTPVVLIVKPAGAFLSLAATIAGFLRFRDHSMIAGILLSQCSDSFYQKLQPMLEQETGLKVYGYLPDLPGARLGGRHLGLATPDSVHDLRERIAVLTRQYEESVDVDGLLALAASAPPLGGRLPEIAPVSTRITRIAVARDAAFCFYYHENLEMLEDLGAELAYFSPLADAGLPEGIGGLYIGGGYPELHLPALRDNETMRRSVREAVRAGLPTLAECGGFLYLQDAIRDRDGKAFATAGALPGEGFYAERLTRFGYVNLMAGRDNMLCRAGEQIRAHEFHYWDSDRPGGDCTAQKPYGGGSWPCVTAGPSLFAGFPHLYFWSNPEFAWNYVAAALAWSEK